MAADTTQRQSRREGSALIVVMIMVMSLMILGLVTTQGALTRSAAASDTADAARALWAAEAAIGIKLAELEASSGSDTTGNTHVFSDGTDVNVTVTQEGDYQRIVAQATVNPGTVRETTRAIEVYVKAAVHPLFYKATYVGNSHDVSDYKLVLGPSVGSTVGGGTWSEGTWRSGSYNMDESDLQIDINGDGDMNDTHDIGDVWDERDDWGWSMERTWSGRSWRYRIDIDKDGDRNDSYTAPETYVPPAHANPSNDLTPDRDDDDNTGDGSGDWETNNPTTDADYVDGDIYVNGDLDLNGSTTVWGDIDTTGETQGDSVTGTTTNEAPLITPPDLAAMNYESIADLVVDASNIDNVSFMRDQEGSSYYGSDLGDSSDHTNRHFHLGNRSGDVDNDIGDYDGKLIYVKGNLWLHDTSGFTTDLPSGEDIQVTIVVEGNLYIADDLQYNNGSNGNTGVLFIVKGNDDTPESYVDTNKNYKYDDGEQIINDDGDGDYEGPTEGQGNVFFGDPRFGTGGVTDGYIYAQNNVYLVNPPVSASPPSGQDRVFGVKGFLSAGGIMDLGDRTAGGTFNNFRVTYDPRLEPNHPRKISFKGMPGALGGGFQGLEVATWREVQ